MLADPMGAAMPGSPPAPVPAPAIAPQPQSVTLHDVTIVRKKEYGCARVWPVPPEEFGISRRAKSIADADYCFHETIKTQAELIAQGFDEDQIRGLPAGSESVDTTGTETDARDTVEENDETDSGTKNQATRPIRVTEHYVRLDMHGDGKAKRYRITTGGNTNTILKRGGKRAVDKIDGNPFAAMTPIPITHRFFGKSIADIVADIQRIKTALLRAILDNAYLANNQRMEIAESHASKTTLEDLLANRPGGVVRTKAPGGLIPIQNREIGSTIFPVMEYMDATREWRTGVTRQGQGIDAKALADQSATAASQMFTMAQARMRLIARIMAETGIRDMFLLLHGVIRKNDRKENTFRLRNKWVTVDPRNWKTRNDMTVTVGVGAGSKSEQMAFLMALLGIQKEALAAGGLGLVTPENIYNTLKKMVPLGNLPGIEPYFTDPKTSPPKPPPPDPKMVEVEGKMKAKEAELAMKAQSDQADAQAQQQSAMMDAQLRREEMERKFAMDQQQMAAEFELKRQQLVEELKLKRELGMITAATNASVATSKVHMGGEPG